jgi:hypothetical protein
MSDIDYSQRPLTYKDVESYTQGVEIKNLARRRAVSTLPIIYSGKGDLTIEQQDFGIVAEEPFLTPFTDKLGRITADIALDLGRNAFLETQSYHTEDVSTYNGAIEPLTIRGQLTSTASDIPGERTIKCDVGFLSTNSRPAPIQDDWIDVSEKGKSGNAFHDAQEQFADQALPGYSGMHQAQPVAFSDAVTVKSVYYTGRYFRENGEFGTSRKSLGRGFTYDNCDVGTDSIAFGGLKR